MAADTLRFQHYEVARRPDGSLHELGAGAMGITYRAFDTNLRVPVALKVINAAYLGNENARQRFLREARTAAQLRHPNVAAIYHLGQAGDDTYFYAMELIEGETFDALVRREKHLEPRFALELALQVTRALAAAHERGLIHRDIKPSNLMLYRQHGEPLVKVIDFGLAKAIQLEEGAEPLPALTQTEAGDFVGTPQYASPEQLEGLPVDTRSDIYSLGITLWFMLAGRPPFEGSTLARIVTQHLCRQPPFDQLADTPAPLRSLLGRMLEKDPQLRPQHPLALRDEMLLALRELGESPTVPSEGKPRPAASAAATPASTPASEDDLNYGATVISPAPPSEHLRAGDFQPGALLGGGRYKLDKAIDENAFAATVVATGQPATVRLLFAGDSSAAETRRLADVVERMRAATVVHPHLLQPLDFAPASTGGDAGYLVLEGQGRDTLLDLLTHRNGALTLPETLALLEPVAAAIEALTTLGMTNPDLRPAFIFLPGAAASDIAAHAAGLKLGPTEFFATSPAATQRGEQTIVDGGAEFLALAGSGCRALGWLAYEMLGGSPRAVETGHYAPLPALDEAGNAVLRRCCVGATAAGETEVGDVRPREFVAALRRCVAATTTAGASSKEDDGKPREAVALSAPARGATPLPSLPRRAWSVATFVLFLVLVDVGALGTWYGWKHYRPTPRVAASLPPVATASSAPVSPPSAEPPPAVPAPFRADTVWENSLGMKFAPVAAASNKGQFLASIWPTRVGDFAAFVRATRYDATGGMVSLGADGRRRQDARLSWQDPGFGQAATHPVVGVNFEDANAFCAWLTQREHDAGLLPATHRYRLPTDTEWSQLAGLREEPGDLLPEVRGLRAAAPDLFPWGDAWPPPAAAGNYAGAELSELPVADRLENYRDDFPRTAPAGSFPPNTLGLCDVGGNVWQWCSDRYKAGADWRTVRGGSWLSGTRAQMRLGARQGYAPAFRHDDIGFRVVLATQP